MELTALVAILIRLFALKTALDAVFPVAAGIQMLAVMGFEGERLMPSLGYFILIVMSACLWFAAVPLSRLILAHRDARIDFTALDVRDVYCIGIVFIGLAVCIASLPSILISAHFLFSLGDTGSAEDPDRYRAFRELAHWIIRAAIGFGLVVGAPRLSTRLAAAHVKGITAPNQAMGGAAR